MTSTQSTVLKEGTIRKLRQMRRANQGIRSCIEVLNEHIINKGSMPGDPCVWIRLNAEQEGGLLYAIEACSQRISNIFDTDIEDLGVYWQDDFMPEISAEAKAHAEMTRGDITFAEFEKRLSGEDHFESAKDMIIEYQNTHTKEEFADLVALLKSMHKIKQGERAELVH